MVTRALAVLLALAGVAAADTTLARAKAALDGVRYDEAQKLLLDALHEGKSGPAEVAEIYRLSASTAIVLGHRDVAEQYYRRWIALEPQASLPASTAPKLREPFVAAQAYMAAHGQLAVTVARKTASDVIVEVADPLAMVAAVALDAGAPAHLDVDHRATLAIAATAAGGTVVVLDEFGNHLRELPVGEPPAVQPPQPPPPPNHVVQPPPPPSPKPETPSQPGFYRNWKLWAIATGAVGVVGVYFGLQADREASALSNTLMTNGFYSDAEAQRNARDRDAKLCDGFLAGAAVLGIATVIVYATRPNTDATTIVPTAAPGSLGASISGAF